MEEDGGIQLNPRGAEAARNLRTVVQSSGVHEFRFRVCDLFGPNNKTPNECRRHLACTSDAHVEQRSEELSSTAGVGCCARGEVVALRSARFEPGDHARYLKMARASLVECQNHLVDAMDRRLISDSVREEHEKRIQGVLNGIGGLIRLSAIPGGQEKRRTHQTTAGRPTRSPFER